jgi:hypothetical protein
MGATRLLILEGAAYHSGLLHLGFVVHDSSAALQGLGELRIPLATPHEYEQPCSGSAERQSFSRLNENDVGRGLWIEKSGA